MRGPAMFRSLVRRSARQSNPRLGPRASGRPLAFVAMSTPLLADLLRAAAADEPGREAYVHDDKRVDYRWLDRRRRRLRHHAARRRRPAGRRGVPHGAELDQVAACYFGAAGAITSAINLRLDRPNKRASWPAPTRGDRRG